MNISLSKKHSAVQSRDITPIPSRDITLSTFLQELYPFPDFDLISIHAAPAAKCCIRM